MNVPDYWLLLIGPVGAIFLAAAVVYFTRDPEHDGQPDDR